MKQFLKLLIIFLTSAHFCFSQSFTEQMRKTLIPVGDGWSGNSVNVNIFRKNSLTSFQNTQFIAYYDSLGYVVLGKRLLNENTWEMRQTSLKGNIRDAHNSISIMVDGEGILHISWNHHDDSLNYTKSKYPLSLELEEKQPMTGANEAKVTYPQFFKMPSGDLVFMYRDGQSGRGNLVLNSYDLKQKRWTQLQNNLINGENERNAYWQACVDDKGIIHLSWVWRETWDVASNHDLCYAKSEDGGKTWKQSSGMPYNLPITMNSAECISEIPENSELINQTAMVTDTFGQPYIASYWREQGSDIPQFHIVYQSKDGWKRLSPNFRKTPFSLSGGGTKRIPISRPQIVISENNSPILIFRDEERGSKVSIAVCESIKQNRWIIYDFTDYSVGSWEPSYDTELWNEQKKLHLFIQNVDQIDGEGISTMVSQPVSVMEIE